MKTHNPFKKFGLALVAMTLVFTAVNAQQRYKHLPRVKIEKTPIETVATNESKATLTTTAQISNVDEKVAEQEATIPVIENNTTVASSENVVVLEAKTKSVVTNNNFEKNEKKAPYNGFTNAVKKDSKLMEVKDTKKANMERWLLIFILLIAGAVLFLILAVVFAVALYYSASLLLPTIFYIISGILFVAAGVVLVLGLAGVM